MCDRPQPFSNDASVHLPTFSDLTEKNMNKIKTSCSFRVRFFGPSGQPHMPLSPPPPPKKKCHAYLLFDGKQSFKKPFKPLKHNTLFHNMSKRRS